MLQYPGNISKIRKPINMSEVFFSGTEGKLQGYYKQQNSTCAALVLPPYPQYGGTMNNRVVHALYNSFLENGFSTLKMNFRGVQKSGGNISNSDNELLKDVSSAINWLQERKPILSEFWIGGFSFGAWASTNLIMRRPETTGFIAVAPPVGRYDFSFLAPCLVPGLIIQGDSDYITDHNLVEKLAIKLQSKVKEIKYHCIYGGDYKFSNSDHVNEIYDVAKDYIKKIINDEYDFVYEGKASEYEFEDV